MSMKWISLCFALQFLVAASIFVTGPRKDRHIQDDHRNRTVPRSLAGNAPRADMMPQNFNKTYLREGAGCGKKPTWTKPAGVLLYTVLHGGVPPPAIKFNSLYNETSVAKVMRLAGLRSEWNGFCQTGWTLCPDAVANSDYSYYWKGLGKDYAKANAYVDKAYCAKNGWLKPEIRAIAHDFKALQKFGQEECETKWKNYGMETQGLYHNLLSSEISVVDDVNAITTNDSTAKYMGVTELEDRMATYGAGAVFMDDESAHERAAWNCAMGDVACDIFYCNAAYCEDRHGQVGMMGECEGWHEEYNEIF